MSIESWMNAPRKSPDGSDVIIDPFRSEVILAAAARDGKIKIDMTPGKLEQAVDIIMHRSYSMLPKDPDAAFADALSVFSIYEKPSLQLNASFLKNVDYQDILNLGFNEVYIVSSDETSRWTENDLQSLKAKAMLLAQEVEYLQNGTVEDLDLDVSLGSLFTVQDLADMFIFRDLFLDQARKNSMLEPISDNLPHLLGVLSLNDWVKESFVSDFERESGVSGTEFRMQLNRVVIDARDMLTDIRSLIENSCETGLSATWSCATHPSVSLEEVVRNAKDDKWLVVNALLNETNFLPDCTSYDEACRHKESSEVKQLRRTLDYWNEAFVSGDVQLEKEIRVALQKSSEQLRKAKKVREIGGITNTVAVPLAIAELFVGLPPVGSLSLGCMGASFSGAAKIIEKKNKWNLWANT